MYVNIFLVAQDSFKNLGDQLIKTHALKNIQFTSLGLDTKQSAMFRNTLTQSKNLFHKVTENNF